MATPLERLAKAGILTADHTKAGKTIAGAWKKDKEKARKDLAGRSIRAVRNVAVYERLPGWFRRQQNGMPRPEDGRRAKSLVSGLEALT